MCVCVCGVCVCGVWCCVCVCVCCKDFITNFLTHVHHHPNACCDCIYTCAHDHLPDGGAPELPVNDHELIEMPPTAPGLGVCGWVGCGLWGVRVDDDVVAWCVVVAHLARTHTYSFTTHDPEPYRSPTHPPMTFLCFQSWLMGVQCSRAWGASPSPVELTIIPRFVWLWGVSARADTMSTLGRGLGMGRH